MAENNNENIKKGQGRMKMDKQMAHKKAHMIQALVEQGKKTGVWIISSLPTSSRRSSLIPIR